MLNRTAPNKLKLNPATGVFSYLNNTNTIIWEARYLRKQDVEGKQMYPKIDSSPNYNGTQLPNKS
jgi:hypothetical protein